MVTELQVIEIARELHTQKSGEFVSIYMQEGAKILRSNLENDSDLSKYLMIGKRLLTDFEFNIFKLFMEASPENLTQLKVNVNMKGLAQVIGIFDQVGNFLIAEEENTLFTTKLLPLALKRAASAGIDIHSSNTVKSLLENLPLLPIPVPKTKPVVPKPEPVPVPEAEPVVPEPDPTLPEHPTGGSSWYTDPLIIIGLFVIVAGTAYLIKIYYDDWMKEKDQVPLDNIISNENDCINITPKYDNSSSIVSISNPVLEITPLSYLDMFTQLTLLQKATIIYSSCAILLGLSSFAGVCWLLRKYWFYNYCKINNIV